MEHVIEEVYRDCIEQTKLPRVQQKNAVRKIYSSFTAEEISGKISEMLTPKSITTEVEIIYQTIENLHAACPNNTGDWYFTGNYPTPGGNKVVNKAFINWKEGVNERAY
jgi:amidophosphoribosyltransferase